MALKESKLSYHHGDLKEALLEAAERLLEQSGVARLSLRNVAREAGVSHNAPYRHFRDKTALLAGLAQVGFSRLAEAMIEAEQRYSEDPAAQIRQAGLSYVSLAVRSPEMTNLMFGGIPREDLGPDFQDACDTAFAGLVKIIENGQRTGIYGEKDTMDLAMAAWSAVHGLAALISTGSLKEAIKSEPSVESLVDAVGDILFFGMLKGQGRVDEQKVV